MLRSDRSPRAYEGQVLILIAVGSIVLFAFAALAVDAGLALSERRGAQNAADAASLAAARAMVDGESNPTVLREMARHYAQLNGYDIADLASDVRFPDAETVEVDINHEVRRVFLGAFYDGDWSVRAEATASLDTVPADYGLIALSESGDAIQAHGNTHINVQDGGMMSNSNILCGGSSTITADTAVHAAGDINSPGPWCPIEGDQNTSDGRAPIEDPLAGVATPPNPFPQPSPPGLPDGYCEAEDQPHNSYVVCHPGRYTSWPGMAASGWGLRLMPGTYYFDNAGTVTTNPYSRKQIEVTSGATYNFYARNTTFNINNARLDLSNNPVNMYFNNSTFGLTGSTDVVSLGSGEFYFENSRFIAGSGMNSLTLGSGNYNFRDSEFVLAGGLDLATLGSGLYYFDNSDFDIGSGASAVGDGVSFFFRNGGRFESSGNSQRVEFTAPSTPLYGEQGNMLFHVEAGSDTTLKIGAFSRMLLDGIVYAPDSHLEVSGNVDGTWARGQLIVNTFHASGSLGTAASPSLVEYQQYVEMGTPQVWLIR